MTGSAVETLLRERCAGQPRASSLNGSRYRAGWIRHRAAVVVAVLLGIALGLVGVDSASAAGAGTLVGWGNGAQGQLTTPAGLGGGVVSVSGGEIHTVAALRDGTVIAWGTDNFGQTSVPAGLSGVTAVSAGAYYSLALKSDGTVVGWGNNNAGQATPPADLTAVAAISAGGAHALALRSDGSVRG